MLLCYHQNIAPSLVACCDACILASTDKEKDTAPAFKSRIGHLHTSLRSYPTDRDVVLRS